MLKKTLVMCALIVCGWTSLQAMESETPSSNSVEISSDRENQQDTFARCKRCRDKILICEEKDQQDVLVCEEKDKQDEALACEEKDQGIIVCEEKDKQDEALACEEKDLTPGVLVCNDSEVACSKEGDKEETASSILFSVFCDDVQKDLLVCTECE
jgi:hypothetical protein